MSAWKTAVFGLILIASATWILTHYVARVEPRQSPRLAADMNADETPRADSPTAGTDAESAETAAFLQEYNATYRELWTAAEGAKWTANSDITDVNEARSVTADQALGNFVGSPQIIATLRRLRVPDVFATLNSLQQRQVKAAWRLAAHYPGTTPDTVIELVAAEASQNSALYSFDFVLKTPGEEVRPIRSNEIAELLRTSNDPEERRAVWECSKTVGPGLKNGLVRLRDLRNSVAREMDFSSFFGLEVADYDMTSAEMMALMDELLTGIRPLYEQLHCWTRHTLAARYGIAVPDLIPAHWLGNRWAQEWPGLVEGIDLDTLFAGRSPQWVTRKAEDFYASMNFPNLPETFWQRSDLYEVQAGSARRKNSHASAWHIDLDQDVRSLMSVRPDYDWFTTAHHELGHIYYYLAYSNENVPCILRAGANRGFHEAVGTLIELASNQVPYLQAIGLMGPDDAPPQIRWLLSQALLGPVTFLPFACGTMTHFEHDLYENDLPADQFNQRWWHYVRRYQGVAAPSPRGEEFCDAATKTHINNDPGQYYDYAISAVILHQLHRHICTEILNEDVRAANYYGNIEVGQWLQSILSVGATRDWRGLLLATTGEPLSSQAMLEYFSPLQQWLEEQNAGHNTNF